ncbi:hypothetical protein SAMN05660895_1296 [Thermoflavifilum thermophilum]|uniref:Uncharacterized protein n=1 Tax=Thermoflavifilum thermophilum TaxID=1393122 RepID=A0A1I7NCC9_9BACT|nr:hypothetical protein SAMN05660895_1296 [Thermoflavifilum thermophilum]
MHEIKNPNLLVGGDPGRSPDQCKYNKNIFFGKFQHMLTQPMSRLPEETELQAKHDLQFFDSKYAKKN